MRTQPNDMVLKWQNNEIEQIEALRKSSATQFVATLKTLDSRLTSIM